MHVALVALDWGTSSCRAYALGSDGRLLESRSRPLGILAVGTAADAYPHALSEIADDWLADAPPVLACGMVGSARGWRDAGYRQAPVQLAELATTGPVATVAAPTGTVHLVPGVRTDTGVMRGEETQLLGAALTGLQSDPVVLPGTHSKWAQLRGGVLDDFHTAMTGELYALLLARGTIAQVAAPVGEADPEGVDGGARRGLQPSPEGSLSSGFDGGARLGLDRAPEGVLSLAFQARSRVLTGSLRPEQVRDFLSGLLIAAEVRGATAWLGEQPQRVTLVGAEELCDRYRRVLELAGIRARRPEADLTLTGLVHLARTLDLLPPPVGAGAGAGAENDRRSE